MTEKSKRMIQTLDLVGEDIAASPFWAERQKRFIERIEQERIRLKALLEGRGMIPKKENNGGEL